LRREEERREERREEREKRERRESVCGESLRVLLLTSDLSFSKYSSCE